MSILNCKKKEFRILTSIQNGRVYIITIIISLVLIFLAFIYPACSRLVVSAGIGCSGLAAAIMAVFIDYINEKKRKEKIKAGRSKYLSEIYSDLRRLVGQFLWMSEHLEDDWFAWDSLSGKQFFTPVQHCIVPEEKRDLIADKSITIEEAKEELKAFSNGKFEWGNIDSLDSNIKNRLLKMYSALYEGNQDLIQETIQLDKNKLYLDSEEYLMLEETSYLHRGLSEVISSINPNSKYPMELCPSVLAELLDKLVKITEKEEKIIVGRHTTFFN